MPSFDVSLYKPLGRIRSTRIALLAFALATSAIAQDAFQARLATMPIEVATRELITGSGSGSAALAGTTLTVRGTFSGMRGPASAARVHQGPMMSVRGPALFDLKIAADSQGEFSGKFKLTAKQVESLRQGRMYIQIHSESAPDGNLWGWLLP